MQIAFDNSYARLPEHFFTRQAPTPVARPNLIALNDGLADRLGLDPEGLRTAHGLSMLAGNAVPDGAAPLAQAYAGHQFGNFVPQLGDGRALLIGEVLAPDGVRFDLQLKGSGPTPYSRMGDGRAWLGPVLREYIMSEAMAALGIPTTRALAAVETGEAVERETTLPGAVLTRVAASHIRVGTFQYFAARDDVEALEALTEHALARHAPGGNSALDLLAATMEKQANLVAAWMGVGFIHGVMNTDNMAISGETIDYGPCAYLDAYHPMRVFSSIDRGGRYAYARQPDMAMWNLAQLAMALLPLIGDSEAAQKELDRFPALFKTAWLARFRAKLGLQSEEDGDEALIHEVLNAMAENQADFTRTFRAFGTPKARDEFLDPSAFDAWEAKWIARLEREGTSPTEHKPVMDAVNPGLIARTHRIEAAIQAAVSGNFSPFHRLTKALETPFDVAEKDHDLTRAPTQDEIVPRTFCGT